MNEQITAPDRSSAAAEPPFTGSGTAPTWTPVDLTAFAVPAPAAPGRQRLRDRVSALRSRAIRLWVALAVGVVALAVGLGLGLLVGHGTADSGRPQQPPGIGQGLGPQDGPGLRGPGPGGASGTSGSSGSSGSSGTGSGATSGTLS